MPRKRQMKLQARHYLVGEARKAIRNGGSIAETITSLTDRFPHYNHTHIRDIVNRESVRWTILQQVNNANPGSFVNLNKIARCRDTTKPARVNLTIHGTNSNTGLPTYTNATVQVHPSGRLRDILTEAIEGARLAAVQHDSPILELGADLYRQMASKVEIKWIDCDPGND